MHDTLWDIIPHLAGLAAFLVSVAATVHVILHKRDTRAAAGWVGIIWLVPVLGPALYVLLGINRIRRKARFLKASLEGTDLPVYDGKAEYGHEVPEEYLAFSSLVRRVVQKPLLQGNSVEPLLNGDSAYPSMLKAIEGARHSVNLSTYIFGNDRAGKGFIDALGQAAARGVQVRVLVDDMGARYSWPPVDRAALRRGIKVARFMRTLVPWRVPFMNLRNHRKIMVVDGRVGFTGGMNIREGHLVGQAPRHPVQDIHFRVEGAVVAHMQEIFIEDWAFCTNEVLQGEEWFPPAGRAGGCIARGIADGPDEDFEKLQWIIHGALMAARKSVRVVTPYFIPDSPLIKTLNLAAMRGVQVEVVLPQKNNLPFVGWASMDLLRQILEHGCGVWLSPPPFDHSKLMVVDGVWSLIGSANWDTRSLRLNFEFNLECYDRGLAASLEGIIEQKKSAARKVTLEDVNRRPLPMKIRDGVARLFSPYI